MSTWRLLLAEAAESLDDSRDGRRIIAECAGETMAGLTLVLDAEATDEGASRARRLVERRKRGEPLQHVLGVWGFRALEVVVDGRALVPRPETEVVVEHALAELDRWHGEFPGERAVAADLGTGSGVIALSIASERSYTDVIALDCSSEALSLAAENLGRACRDVARRVELRKGDLFDGLARASETQLALVVSNPPYLAASEWAGLDPEVRDFDPYGALVAGETGLEVIERLVKEAPRWLAPAGSLVVEIATHQSGGVLSMVARSGAYSSFVVCPDLAGRPRVLVAEVPR